VAGIDFVFNIARGALKYYYDAVKNNRALASAGQFTSTANSALIIVLMETTSLETDPGLRDYDDLAALIAAAGNNEPTGGTYARKTLTDADLAALPAPDDTNERLVLDIPDQTYTALSTTGNNAIGKVLVCFDPDTTAGTDSSIIPLTAHAVSVTPDGNDVVLQIAAAGFWRSS
jgi:hypothetical protein